MIARIWHGWATPENADAYEAKTQRLLARFDERSRHHEVRVEPPAA